MFWLLQGENKSSSFNHKRSSRLLIKLLQKYHLYKKIPGHFKDIQENNLFFKDFPGLEIFFWFSRTFKDFKDAYEPCMSTFRTFVGKGEGSVTKVKSFNFNLPLTFWDGPSHALTLFSLLVNCNENGIILWINSGKCIVTLYYSKPLT